MGKFLTLLNHLAITVINGKVGNIDLVYRIIKLISVGIVYLKQIILILCQNL